MTEREILDECETILQLVITDTRELIKRIRDAYELFRAGKLTRAQYLMSVETHLMGIDLIIGQRAGLAAAGIRGTLEREANGETHA